MKGERKDESIKFEFINLSSIFLDLFYVTYIGLINLYSLPYEVI